ncbi:MAG: hypothetical protein ACREPL_07900 [Rhodanobacteraceae bacterium]
MRHAAPPALPAVATTVYEDLRLAVLSGGVRPEGLGAIGYHGLVEGLRRLCASSESVRTADAPATGTGTAMPWSGAGHHELLHLLANMVLEVQAEASHAY